MLKKLLHSLTHVVEPNSPPQRFFENPRHWQSNNMLCETDALFTLPLQNFQMWKQTRYLHVFLKHWHKQKVRKNSLQLSDQRLARSVHKLSHNFANEEPDSTPQHSRSKSEARPQQQVRQTAQPIVELDPNVQFIPTKDVRASFPYASKRRVGACNTKLSSSTRYPRTQVSCQRSNADIQPSSSVFCQRPHADTVPLLAARFGLGLLR